MKPHERMNWDAMADSAFCRESRMMLKKIGRCAWSGFWALIREDYRFWGIAGYYLHKFWRMACETKQKLTQHLTTPSKLWTHELAYLKHFANWCADRSIKLSK